MLPFALLIGLAAFLYSRALAWWYYEWTANGSFYAHGVFIPFFVGAMVWRDREIDLFWIFDSPKFHAILLNHL